MTYPDITSSLIPGEIAVREIGFIIETWRQAAAGNGTTPRLLRAFAKRCGTQAEEVMEAYFIFLRVLGRSSRRRLAVGHPGCPGITRDEIQVLSLLAGAQSGHWALFDAHLCWLVPEDSRPTVTAAATILADAFARHGMKISGGLHIEPSRGSMTWGPALVRAQSR